MNKIVTLCFALILLAGCSSDEVKFQAFSAEAFAFQVDNTWEVNASFFVKGFQLTEKDEGFFPDISYSVELILADGTRKEVFTENVQLKEQEEITDKKLEADFVLDSTYSAGTYKLIFAATDNSSKQKTSVEKELTLEGIETK
jgi:hypothetical protein